MRALLIVFLGALLIAAVAGAIGGVAKLGGAVSPSGWFALALGSFLSLALGALLMGLVFYSARKGYDERVAPDPAAPDGADADEHDA
jgi:hypothetical protein